MKNNQTDNRDFMASSESELLYNRWKPLIAEPIKSGNSEVYRVVDTRGEFSGDLALKVLHKIARIQQFEREVRSLQFLATLHTPHTNIVPLLYSNIVPDETQKRPYLVTPWLHHGTLQRNINEKYYLGRITEAVQVLLPVVNAVKFLHDQALAPERYLAHRDIKPSNILFDAENRPALTDFGCVYFDERLTGDERVGSTGYTAPELRSGRYDEDHRPADIYSIGAVFYAMLSGNNPPDDGNILSDDYHLSKLFNNSESVEIHQLLAWCMASSPNKRPDVATMISELEMLIQPKNVTAQQEAPRLSNLLRRIDRLQYQNDVLTAKKSEAEIQEVQNKFSPLTTNFLNILTSNDDIQALINQPNQPYTLRPENHGGNGSSLSHLMGRYRPMHELLKRQNEQPLINGVLQTYRVASLTLEPTRYYADKLVRVVIVVALGLLENHDIVVVLGMVSAYDISSGSPQLCDWIAEPVMFPTSYQSLRLERSVLGLPNKLVRQSLEAVQWGLDHYENSLALPICPIDPAP